MNTPEYAANCKEKMPHEDDGLTLEIAIKVVEQNPEEFTRLPKEFITPETCLAAVKNAGWMLQHVPEEYKTREVCLVAIRCFGSPFLMYVPAKMLITPEFWLAFVQDSDSGMAPGAIEALEYMPKALKTSEFCLAAVQKDGNALKYLPEKFKTAKICLIAVQKAPWMLDYVPSAFTNEVRDAVWGIGSMHD